MIPNDARPDPDDLLAKVTAEERTAAPGRLKIFFGSCAGVGKTYAMLSEAHELVERGREVAVGWVEPHERPETTALLKGLPALPPRIVEHRGVRIEEFDLDLALLARPSLILVDELAHTVAPGGRHAKRWQDVEELLQAGIDVYTSLNVQHLESLNDLVARITGVVVRETVPDRVFDRADEVELVDLPPEELIQRLREGKVYVPEEAERALSRFFSRETLTALRELALRKTADHVNRQVEIGRRGTAARTVWATRERLLVGVSSSPTSARLVRAARRMARELRAPWYAAHFESSPPRPLSEPARAQLSRNLELAERLGAEVVTISGLHAADELVRFARKNGVTKLILGKSPLRLRQRLGGLSLVDRVLRLSGDIDVLLIRGDEEGQAQPVNVREKDAEMDAQTRRRVASILAASLGGALAIGLVLFHLGSNTENIVLVFLVATVVVAARAGRIASVIASLLGVVVFNFFFIDPRFTFVASDLQYVFTFLVLLASGLLASTLVGRLRQQSETARSQAEANLLLYRFGGALSSTTGAHQLAERAQREIEQWLGLASALYLTVGDPEERRLGDALGARSIADDPRERAVAAWVLRNAQPAGRSTDTLPAARAHHLPLIGIREEPLGVLAVVPAGGELERGQRRLLSAIATQIALAIERDLLGQTVAAALLRAEGERTRADLLATVSHDLRTPLATIQGAASTLLEHGTSMGLEESRILLTDIVSESEHLGRIVENLLHLGRFGAGKLEPRRDRFPLEELVEAAQQRLRHTGGVERIRVSLPAEPILLDVDGDLVIQLMWNLLDNALRYAPEGAIELAVQPRPDGGLLLEVLDRGPGLPPGDPEILFERFVRGEPRARTRGTGLGLAISRAIARVHGGRLHAEPRPGGGARFVLELPPSCVAADDAREERAEQEA